MNKKQRLLDVVGVIKSDIARGTHISYEYIELMAVAYNVDPQLVLKEMKKEDK